MTRAAGVREQTASPWKHMLASVSIEEPCSATLELLYTPIWSPSPRGRVEIRPIDTGKEGTQRGTPIVSATSCYAYVYVVKDIPTCDGPVIQIKWDGEKSPKFSASKGSLDENWVDVQKTSSSKENGSTNTKFKLRIANVCKSFQEQTSRRQKINAKFVCLFHVNSHHLSTDHY